MDFRLCFINCFLSMRSPRACGTPKRVNHTDLSRCGVPELAGLPRELITLTSLDAESPSLRDSLESIMKGLSIMIVKCSFSGGKDSMTALCLWKDLNPSVIHACNFIPMLTDDIPLLTKRHYEFIQEFMNTPQDGVVFHTVKGTNFYDWCLSNGYPGIRVCGFRQVKVKALESLGDFNCDVEDIGIAFDEPKRFHSLVGKKRSILVEYQYTENDCFRYCYSRGLLSPHYLLSTRDGCVLCPNGSQLVRDVWLDDYPQAREVLLSLDSSVFSSFTDNFLCYPLRGYKKYFSFLY